MSTSGGGQVLAEGVLPASDATPDAPFEPVFFRDVPLHLTAVPDEGYYFVGWSGVVDGGAPTRCRSC